MKKIFLTAYVILLFATNLSGQAQVDIPIYVYDNTGLGGSIYFGLDLIATDGIDPQFGEENLPAVPPGVFDMRWWLPPFLGELTSWRDYRAPGIPPTFPYTGSKDYFFSVQTSITAYPITISWNLPPQIAPTSRILGGLNIDTVFAGTGSIVVTYPYGQFFIFVDYDNIIPVEFISFFAEALENVVALNWSTATETNNSGFEIQRNGDSPLPGGERKGWVSIGFAPGFGTSTEPKSYLFIDENVTTGTYKYRLKQIDFDGSFNYSNEIEVVVDFIPKEFVLYQNYPNPFNPNTTISWQSPVSSWQTLKIFDVLSNEVVTLVDEYRPAGKYEIEFHPESGIRYPASGVYFYVLKAGSFIQTKKMVLIK